MPATNQSENLQMRDDFILLTNLPESEIEELCQEPFETKKRLGEIVVDKLPSKPYLNR